MSRAERIAGARAALAERAEREARLPRAACRECGGIAHAGEGDVLDVSVWETIRERQEREVMESRLPKEVGRWRRTCRACADGSVADILATVLDINATPVDADTAWRALTSWDPIRERFVFPVPFAHEVGRWGRRPWEHIGDDERASIRARFLEALGEIEAARHPRTSSFGGCGFCGVAAIVGTWWEAPSTVRWPDGSLAALCDTCHDVHEARGAPTDLDDLRRVGIEIATGRPVPLGDAAPAAFRLAFEHRDADRTGNLAAWAYSDGLSEYREQVWEREPQYAPADRRREFLERRAARRAEEIERARIERETAEAAAW